MKDRRDTLRPKANLDFLLDSYQDSQEFAKLAPRTRTDYAKLLRAIDAAFGDFPIRLLADRRCRADFLAWRDKLAKRSERHADYAWTVLARALSWAVGRGLAPDNPCVKGGRLYTATRADKIWTPADEAAFVAKASPALNLAMQLALWTGQRQGDLLKLTWFAYDGTYVRLQQGKTGVRVTIPIGRPCASCSTPRAPLRLAAAARSCGTAPAATGRRTAFARRGERRAARPASSA